MSQDIVTDPPNPPRVEEAPALQPVTPTPSRMPQRPGAKKKPVKKRRS